MEKAKIDGIHNNNNIIVEKKSLNTVLLAMTKLQLANYDEEETGLPKVLRFNVPSLTFGKSIYKIITYGKS